MLSLVRLKPCRIIAAVRGADTIVKYQARGHNLSAIYERNAYKVSAS